MRTSVITVLTTAKPKLCLMLLPMAAVIVGATAAPAHAETEPNNDAAHANGPIVENVATSGALFSSDDKDYFKFWVRAGAQVTITYTGTNASATQPNGVASVFDLNIYDATGAPAVGEGAYQVGAGETGTLPMTAAATGTYYAVISASPGFTTGTDPISYSITGSAGGALLMYDPIICDRHGVDVRRIQRSLNRAEGQLNNARKHGRPTSPYKHKIRGLKQQRDGARAARDAACS